MKRRGERSLLGQIAAYGALDAQRDLPDDVVHHAKRALVDWFSALYPGTRIAPAVNLVQAHAAELGVGRSSLPGFGKTAFPSTAAWINGTAAHAVEFDDIFRDAVYHPGCPVIAAALALAEDGGVSGREMLAAITVGYEISTRIGVAVQPSHYRFFHTTGTAGVFGAAAAGAALLAPGDVDVMQHALATSGTFAAGLQQAFRSDSQTKPLHAGHAASMGVNCAMAAAHGVTGAADILEGEAGFGAAMAQGADWSLALEGLGVRYNIMAMTQKNHGCCGHAFAAIDAAIELRGQVSPEEVVSVDVTSYKAALDVAGHREPVSAAEAKFSVPYLVAHALMHGAVRLDAFDDARLGNPQLRALMHKVTLREDPELTAAFPRQRAARVVITVQGGKRFEHFAPFRKGDPEAPLSDEDLDEKFRELVFPVIGDIRGEELLSKLWGVQRLRVRDLNLTA